MTTASTPIHLAAAFDRNYLNPFYAWLASVVGSHDAQPVHLHLIASGLSDTEKAGIEQLGAPHITVTYYTVDEAFFSKFVLLSKWTKAVYYRLFFPFLVPDSIHRLLYIDTDTLVLRNLRTFYDADLEGYPVAAVYDNYVKTQPLLGIHEEGNYFNSGVMLMDLPKWREQKISEQAIAYLLEFPERIRFVDQCGLNAVLIGNWKKMTPPFNLLYSYVPPETSLQELERFVHDTYIVHFTLQRPWEMLCKNRLRALYFKYRDQGGVRAPKYVDFSWGKIPAWLKIRFVEFYFDHAALQRVWRLLKKNTTR